MPSNANVLRTRGLFFVVVLVLHFVWFIVAALDVSSQDTRGQFPRVVVASYNLAVQIVSLSAIATLAYFDRRDVDKSSWISHTFFELAVLAFLSLLQLAGALAYSALTLQVTQDCGSNLGSSTCATAIRAILVGDWTISLLYLLFTLWFTATTVLAAKRDPTVWRSRPRQYDWQSGRQSILLAPASPIDILGNAEKQDSSSPQPFPAAVTAAVAPATADVGPRKMWMPPLIRRMTPRPRLESTPHLPIQNLPPPTPFAPVPPLPAAVTRPPTMTNAAIHLALPRQSIPEDISLSGTPNGGMRPISLVQSLAARTKIMSIKPLRLHRARASVDKSTIGLPRVVTMTGRSTITESKYMNMTLTAAEGQFQHFWDPESSFARRDTTNGIDFPVAPSVSSRYSTGTTIPPTPPPKDSWVLPDSAPPVPHLHFESSSPPERRFGTPPKGYI